MKSTIEILQEESLKLNGEFIKVNFTSRSNFGYSEEIGMFYMEGVNKELVPFNMTAGFLNYLHTSTLKGFVEAKEMKALLNAKAYENLVQYIQVAKEKSENSGKKKTSKHTVYTLALVNNMAYALLVNYVPVQHLEIVEKLAETNSIANRVKSFFITPELMQIRVSSNIVVDNIPDFGFSLVNGMTGINPLSLKGFVTLRNGKHYTFDLKTQKRKHLSLVPMVITEIQDEINQRDLTETVKVLGMKSYDVVFDILKDEIFIPIVSYIQTKITENTVNVLDILNIISEVSSVQGFKVISEKAIEKVVKELCL
jgi:hypothetical protein